MAAGKEVRVAPDVMIRVVRAIFARAGCSEEEATCIATHLTGANLRGHDSHGVIRVPRYVESIEVGRQKVGQTIDVLMENEVMAIVDGKFGFGQSVGEQTVDLGLKKVKAQGLALTALRNSGHLGRIGDWAERAAAAGIASLHMVNVRGSLLVAPFGARDRRMGTTPFCTGIPVKGGAPIIHDFATSTVAEGKALVALKGGKGLPEGSLIDSDGKLTSDPWPLYGDTPEGKVPTPNDGPGALTTFGGHKGSGLNFMIEMMAGALTGSGCAGGPDEPQRRPFCNGMLSIYIDPERMGGSDAVSEEIRSYTAFVKSARTAEGHDEVLIPGEKERRTKAEREAGGLPLAEAVWDDILATARRLGINDLELDRLTA